MTSLRALIVEDSEDDAELLARELRRHGYEVDYERVHDADMLDAALRKGPWDIVFSDHSMPEFGSGAALQMVRSRDIDVPFLIVSGTMGEDVAVDAMRAGANDYFVKGKLARLPAVVDRELRQATAKFARRSLERTFQALRDVSSAIGRLPDPRDVALQATRHTRDLLRVEAAAVHTWDAEAGVLRPFAVDGLPPRGSFVIRPGEGAAGLAFERRDIVAIADVASAARPPQASGDVRSAIAAPLVVGTRTIGVIVALSKQPREFNDEDRQIMQLLAGELAPSFEAGRLFAEAERQRAEAEALAAAAQLVAAGAVARDTIRSILAALDRVVTISAAALFVPTAAGERFTLTHSVGAFKDPGERTFALGGSIVGRALRSGSVQIRARTEAPEESHVVLGASIDLAVPITRDQSVIGVLAISGDDGRFTARDVDLLQRFASLVAMALENARLQGESESRASELERQAHFDALTGLPNRTLFRERLRQLSADPSQPHGLLLIDIDHFKDTNDAFGAATADKLLREIAARLQAWLGGGTLLARIGGDEFAAVVPAKTEEDALASARSIQLGFERAIAIDDEQVPVRVSIGIARFPSDAADVEGLLSRVEVAVQIAKRGDGVASYSAAQDAYAPERLTLMSQLRRAVDRDELILHYQPIVDLRTGAVLRVEALVRWRHPDRGLLPPADVIPLAERSGQMKRLTRWVTGEALRQARRWRDSGLAMSVAVNLPMRTLHDGELPDLVRELLQRSEAQADWLTFEITENDVMADAGGAIRILHNLREMGIRFAIDDFGTGYSSLAYLQRLDVNSVKIDRSFVMAMDQESSATIVRATIDLAHALGLQVVAEGVETPEALTTLTALRCDFAQGFHFARPMPAADLLPWMDARTRSVA